MDRTIHQDKDDRIPIRSASMVMFSLTLAALLTSGVVFAMKRYAPNSASIQFPLGCFFALAHAAVFYYHLRHVSKVNLLKASQHSSTKPQSSVNAPTPSVEDIDYKQSDKPNFIDNPDISASVRFNSNYLLSEYGGDGSDLEDDDLSEDGFLPHLSLGSTPQNAYPNSMSKPPKDVLRHSKLIGSTAGRTSTVFLSDNENPGIEFYIDSSDEEVENEDSNNVRSRRRK